LNYDTHAAPPAQSFLPRTKSLHGALDPNVDTCTF
jgi:hypothetical protein